MNKRLGLPLAVLLLALAGSVALLASRPARGAGSMAMGGHAGHAMAMSDADMRRWAAQYWATHARVGATANLPLAATAVSETVQVTNFIFNADNDVTTQLDTVKILPGDQVVWKWITGLHTVTSGNGSSDPQSGALFNQPSDSAHPFFAFTFANPGTYPYYCVNHELLDMTGVVVVQDLTGVGGAVGAGIGFAGHPWPNPARGSVSFRYDIRQAGRVRAEVLDVRGRVVALVVNEDQAPGSYARTWDGRVSGAPAAAGRYFLRLTLPGYAGTQAVTITR